MHCRAKTHSYQFNPQLTKEEIITNILVKALTIFPSPDFSLCLHLLPPNILDPKTATDPLSDAVRKLAQLNELIESGSYREFWNAFEGEDLYADLVVDCVGFENIMRDGIALQTSMIAREVKKDIAQGWLNVRKDDLAEVVASYGWGLENDVVTIPLNKENEAKTTVFRENVSFNRRLPLCVLRGTGLIGLGVQNFRTLSGAALSRWFRVYRGWKRVMILLELVSISSIVHSTFSFFPWAVKKATAVAHVRSRGWA